MLLPVGVKFSSHGDLPLFPPKRVFWERVSRSIGAPKTQQQPFGMIIVRFDLKTGP